MVDQDEIRERIRSRMADLGLSLTGVWLKQHNIGQTTVRNYLDGMSNSLTVETVTKLAEPLKTTELWLLTGLREARTAPQLNGDEIRQLVRTAMLEVQPGMKLSEIEPIVSEAIREQIERLQSDGEDQGTQASPIVRGKGARSRVPTN